MEAPATSVFHTGLAGFGGGPAPGSCRHQTLPSAVEKYSRPAVVTSSQTKPLIADPSAAGDVHFWASVAVLMA